MTRRSNSLISVIFVSILCGTLSCTSLPFLVPNPPSGRAKPETTAKKKPRQKQSEKTAQKELPADNDRDRKSDDGQVDFSLAFADSPDTAAVKAAPAPRRAAKSIVLPRNRIRVCLKRNTASLVLYALEPVTVRSVSLEKEEKCRGRIAVEALGPGNVSLSAADGTTLEATLPCTLASSGSSNLIEYYQTNFRGSMIVAGSGRLTLINVIDLEEYLRGVVPLEMGRRPAAEIEALKAQAIAARTYGAKSMLDHAAEPFDVLKTVADQVYGGADAETPESDNAVSRTAGMVLFSGDSLISAYYHSTCGGRTANCSDVWDKGDREYLRSIDDTGPDGKAYCAASPFFTWEESWSPDQIARIIGGALPKAYTNARFSGALQAIDIDKRFVCGRVQHCVLWGAGGRAECGGDRVRFVLRRKSASGEILRSANFTVEKNGPEKFTVRGRGYGHGVGMCQTGAIGRARAGQTCEQILKAYFRGVELGKAAY